MSDFSLVGSPLAGLGDLSAEDKKSMSQAVRSVRTGGHSKVLARLVGEDNVRQVAELYRLAGSAVRFFQMEELVKGYVMLEKMRGEYSVSGKLHPLYHQLQRNVIGLTDKMRKQDEGMRLRHEIVKDVDDLRTVVEVQAKTVNVAKGGDVSSVRNASIFKDQ